MFCQLESFIWDSRDRPIGGGFAPGVGQKTFINLVQRGKEYIRAVKNEEFLLGRIKKGEVAGGGESSCLLGGLCGFKSGQAVVKSRIRDGPGLQRAGARDSTSVVDLPGPFHQSRTSLGSALSKKNYGHSVYDAAALSEGRAG